MDEPQTTIIKASQQGSDIVVKLDVDFDVSELLLIRDTIEKHTEECLEEERFYHEKAEKWKRVLGEIDQFLDEYNKITWRFVKTPEEKREAVSEAKDVSRTITQEIPELLTQPQPEALPLLTPSPAPAQPESKAPLCPNCGSKETVSYGSRTTKSGTKTRFLCNSCQRTFTHGIRSERRTEIEQLIEQGMVSTAEIAKKLGISYSLVSYHKRRLAELAEGKAKGEVSPAEVAIREASVPTEEEGKQKPELSVGEAEDTGKTKEGSLEDKEGFEGTFKIRKDDLPTLKEIKLMIDAVSVEEKFRIIFLVQSGMRVSDALKLKIGDLKKELDLGMSPLAITYIPMRDREIMGQRITFIGSDGIKILKQYLEWIRHSREQVSEDNPLFIGRGNQYTKELSSVDQHTMNSTVKNAAKKAGVVGWGSRKVRAHNLREVFYYRLVDSGIEEEIVSFMSCYKVDRKREEYWRQHLEELREIYRGRESFISPLA